MIQSVDSYSVSFSQSKISLKIFEFFSYVNAESKISYIIKFENFNVSG